MTLFGCTGNIALGKSTYSSRISEDGSPSRAVDGDRDPTLDGNSCTQTYKARFAWWAVDLGSVKNVRKVIITNRLEFRKYMALHICFDENQSLDVFSFL